MTDTAETLYLDTILKPNPPMGPMVLGVVLATVGLFDLAFAIGFFLRGAWPIAPFLGADLLLLFWAFRASSIAARAYEHITLTASRLCIWYHPPRGGPKTTTLNPYWVTMRLEEPAEMPRRLWLRSHGNSIQVGRFLAPHERLSFANSLRSALEAAKSPARA